jgi:hypothetical protein
MALRILPDDTQEAVREIAPQAAIHTPLWDKTYAERHMHKTYCLTHNSEGIDASLVLIRGAVSPHLQAEIAEMMHNIPFDRRQRSQIVHDYLADRGRSSDDGLGALAKPRIDHPHWARIPMRGFGAYSLTYKDQDAMPYSYAGATPMDYPMDTGGPTLDRLRTLHNNLFQDPDYNNCLCNLMTHTQASDGSNELGTHRDDEKALDLSKPISCYVGGTRLRSRVIIEWAPQQKTKVDANAGFDKDDMTNLVEAGIIEDWRSRLFQKDPGRPLKKVMIMMAPGDIYAMQGLQFQDVYKHGIPKSRKRAGIQEQGDRFSLTFRRIATQAQV